MENGFELDDVVTPGLVDAIAEGEEAMASGAPMRTLEDVIGEPDAASLDIFSDFDCPYGCMPMDHHDTVTTPVVRASVGGLHSLSFTTVTDDGSHTDTVRLTAAELAQTAIVIEEYIDESE